jgi:hypothetical protein
MKRKSVLLGLLCCGLLSTLCGCYIDPALSGSYSVDVGVGTYYEEDPYYWGRTSIGGITGMMIGAIDGIIVRTRIGHVCHIMANRDEGTKDSRKALCVRFLSSSMIECPHNTLQHCLPVPTESRQETKL